MRRFRGAIGVLGGVVLAAAALGAAPVRTANAAACPSGTVLGSGIGLDPVVSRSDLTATPSPSYYWAAVCGFTPGHATAPNGGAEDSFQINLGAPLPAFPTARPDLGVTFIACADVSGAIDTMPVQVGVNHRGQPVFDGPYPEEDGYKVCAFATTQVGKPLDYGVELSDPNGVFTAIDYPSLVTTGGVPTISAPTGIAEGTQQVTLYLPDTWTYLIDPPPPPLQGVARNFSEPVLDGTTNNAFVATQVGLETSGPILGIAGLLPISGWAPGVLYCAVIANSIPNPNTCFEDSTGGYRNAVDLGVLPLPPAEHAVPTPCVDPFDVGLGNSDCATVSGTTTYFPCQSTNTPGGQDVGDLYAISSAAGVPCTTGGQSLPYEYASRYGRIWPEELPRLSYNQGFFAIGPAFLFSGVDF
jgi:hypothetical protein